MTKIGIVCVMFTFVNLSYYLKLKYQLDDTTQYLSSCDPNISQIDFKQKSEILSFNFQSILSSVFACSKVGNGAIENRSLSSFVVSAASQKSFFEKGLNSE